MVRRACKSVAVIGRAHESVNVIRRALNSEAKPLVKYDVGSRSSGEGQNQTVAAIDDDSEAEEQAKVAKVPDYYQPVFDRFRRRYSSASTYDVPKDSKGEEQAKVPDWYQPVLDRIRRRYSSASTYDVPKDSKAEEQPKVQDSRQVVVDEIRKGSCSPLTYYVPTECRPADKFPPGSVAYWLAIAEEVNERMAAGSGSGTKLTPEEEEAKLRYGPCECCGKVLGYCQMAY